MALPFLVQFAILVAIGFGMSYLMAKKRDAFESEAETKVDAPTAEEGSSVPVLFGTKRIKNPNVVWWGDLKATAIKK